MSALRTGLLQATQKTASSSVTGLQIWTLLVAVLAVLATLTSAYLLRRTGRATVEAARQSASASERSAKTAVAALTETLSKDTNQITQEFFLRELEQKRAGIRARTGHVSSIKYQLGVLMTTADRRAWTRDVGDLSPTGLVLPIIGVDSIHSDMMAMALTEILTSITALTAMFGVAKISQDDEACWKVLAMIKDQCRRGREVAEKSLGAHYSAEARTTSEMHTTRNTIVEWHHRRQTSLMEYLGMPVLESSEAPEPPERPETESVA